jgi:hypothetical protein
MTADRPLSGNPPATPSVQHREFPANGQTIVAPPYQEQETPMVNGQPAIFRPMDLKVDQPPTQ